MLLYFPKQGFISHRRPVSVFCVIFISASDSDFSECGEHSWNNKDLEIQITDAEEQLHQAMLASDVLVLDELLAQDLVCTNHLGQRIGKEDDLSAHKSGA